MPDLRAQSVQFVWFTWETPEQKADAIMQTLLGLEADRMQTNRAPGPAAPFLSSAVRVEQNVELTLNVSPGRIDLYAQPTMTEHLKGLPTLDADQQTSTILESLKGVDFSFLRNIYRLALVVKYVDPVDTLEDGKVRFFSKLGTTAVDGELTDLIFSINKRREVPKYGITTNRLLRYSVDTHQKIEVGFDFNARRPTNNNRSETETK